MLDSIEVVHSKENANHSGFVNPSDASWNESIS